MSAPHRSWGPWAERLARVDEMMRDMSAHTDPQAMVQQYGRRVREFFGTTDFVSLSRRGVQPPFFRVTRSSKWQGRAIDPWKDGHKLPLLSGGLLGELLYADRPQLINDFTPDPADPGYEHLAGSRALLAIPHYENGVAVNMVVSLQAEVGGFEPELVPELVWTSSLFGRATGSLVLSRKLAAANAALEHEMNVVAEIQRSLLPSTLPDLPTLDLAAEYCPSTRASGDYYDFFPLADGRLGMLIADVSGHGTPAAVLMAILHAIAHMRPGEPDPPAHVLSDLNAALAARYTMTTGTFVTAFYGVYDPRSRRLTYSSAGHNPPLLLDGQTGAVGRLDRAQGLPLGVLDDSKYTDASTPLDPGDTLVLYTDGITEAHAPANTTGDRLFGEARLEATIYRCAKVAPVAGAQGVIDEILRDVEAFANGRPADDDRTIVVGRVR
ncbi:MAG: PP2C family protein-serine/threonine phosphatase [Phycisphaerales bacterium]